ncbi:MAG TPA: S8 family serine peptidase, partial [Verrucomicrobiae bacterium]|nr:S8 family serine peptidase [Verrucomicrobiae bacterium]
MKPPQKRIAILIFYAAAFLCAVARAQSLDTIGVTLLRAVTTNLNGAGIRVAQPEAYDNGTTNWEVNPASSLVQQPNSLFTYASNLGSTNNYPNALNTESGHADLVAGNFYGVPAGVATNIAHMDNYDANYFVNSIIGVTFPPNINDPVVNQSFSFGALAATNQQPVDSAYDNYSAEYKTLFVSAVDNAGNVHAPGTSYNCIGVAAYGGSSSVGPTIDNGRAKPDITAPATETSLSTPQVAGAAAVLMQAGLRGDGGSDTNSAADIRTVKALLLNGAVKPADWTNNFPSPLDTRYGAGVLNVFNSYEQLAGGKHSFNFSTNVPAGSAHWPVAIANSIFSLSGWNFTNITSGSASDAVNHYFLNLTNNSSAPFVATMTLVWNRQQGQTNINNLNLFLYDCANSNLV